MSDEKLYLMGCCAIFVPNFGRNVRQVYESVQGFITLNTKVAQSLEMSCKNYRNKHHNVHGNLLPQH